MSPTHTEIDALLQEIETRFPVQEWRAVDFGVWPLVRLRIYWILAVERAATNGGRSRWRRLMDKAAAELRLWKGLLRAGVADRGGRLTIAPSETPGVAFLSDGVSFVSCDGRWYERFCDPIQEHCASRGIGAGKMTLGTPLIPQHSPSEFVGGILRWMRGRSWLTHRLRRFAEPESFTQFSRWLQGRCGIDLSWSSVSKSAHRVASYADFFERKLARWKPRAGFVVSYYCDEGFAFCLACRRLGIPSVDIQHGVQGALHAAYGRWRQVPEHGYELLPSVFLVWSDEEAGTIREWAASSNAPHRPVISGNMFLDLCQAGRIAPVADLTAKIRGRRRPEAIQALYSLNYLETPESLAPLWRAIANERGTPPLQWWLRLHPARLDRLDEFIAKAQSAGIPEDQVRLSTEFPLYAVLPAMDVHVTGSSSTVLEAERFGIQSVVTDVLGTEQFASRVESGVVVFADDLGQVATQVRQQAAKKQSADLARRSDSRIAAAAVALDDLLQASPTASSVRSHVGSNSIVRKAG